MNEDHEYSVAAEWLCKARDLEDKSQILRLKNDVIRADLAQIEADVFRVCAKQLMHEMVNDDGNA